MRRFLTIKGVGKQELENAINTYGKVWFDDEDTVITKTQAGKYCANVLSEARVILSGNLDDAIKRI